MANKILIKKSTVTGKIPLASDLDIGEIAINTADARLYTKHSDDSVRLLRAEPILPDVGTIGTYTKVTTDAQGRITSGGTLSATDIPLLSISKTDGLQSALNLKATIDSPALTGTPTAPTPIFTDNSTKIATTEFVQNMIDSSGGYSGWNISDGTNQEFVNSTSTITMIGSGISSVSYSTSNNTMIISSEIPDDIINTLEDAELYALAAL